MHTRGKYYTDNKEHHDSVIMCANESFVHQLLVLVIVMKKNIYYMEFILEGELSGAAWVKSINKKKYPAGIEWIISL